MQRSRDWFDLEKQEAVRSRNRRLLWVWAGILVSGVVVIVGSRPKPTAPEAPAAPPVVATSRYDELVASDFGPVEAPKNRSKMQRKRDHRREKAAIRRGDSPTKHKKKKKKHLHKRPS